MNTAKLCISEVLRQVQQYIPLALDIAWCGIEFKRCIIFFLHCYVDTNIKINILTI